MPSANGPFLLGIKVKAEENFHMTKMLLIYTLNKRYFNKTCIHFQVY
jgi:hypothetical protein